MATREYVKVTLQRRNYALMDFTYYGYVESENDLTITIRSGYPEVTFVKTDVMIERDAECVS